MRKNLLIVLVLFIAFFQLSYSFANQPLFCGDLFSSHETLSVRKYIKERIKELQGRKNFYEVYKSSYGLLQFTQELSHVTDKVDLILKIALDTLGEDSLKALSWSQLFGGDRNELEALINGFFNEERKLRERAKEYIFVFSEGESFPISGNGGFNRFADKVFSGNRAKALFAAVTVLSPVHIKELNWKKVSQSKGERFLEVIQDLLSKIGNFKNEKGKSLEQLVTDDVLKAAFSAEGFHFSGGRFPRNESFVAFKSSLTEEQKIDSNYKFDDRGKLVREIDVVMQSYTEEEEYGGPLILVEVKSELTLDHVLRFLKTLDIANHLSPDFQNKSFLGGFVFGKAEEEALEKANEEGLYLLKIKHIEIEKVNVEGLFVLRPFPRQSMQ